MFTPDEIRREMERARTRRRNIDDGKSLPSTKELLRASGYLGGDMHWDMRTFADLAARRIRSKTRGATALKTGFQILALEGAGLQDLLEMRDLLKKHGDSVLGSQTSASFQLRLDMYAASMGHPPAMEAVTKECLWRAVETARRHDTFLYLKAAIGWHHMSLYRPFPAENLPGIGRLGENVLEAAFSVWDAVRATPAKPLPNDKPKNSEMSELQPDAPGFLTVLSEVANSDMVVGKRIADEFKDILKRPLPLAPVGDLQKVRQILIEEFPWANSVTGAILADIERKPHIHFRPTIMLGSPGAGKSRYCHRLFVLLGIAYRSYNAGGIADSSLGGTARQWNTACPSLPLSLFRQFRVANPGIVLDEIDKASNSRTNGSLFDTLLAMTEPESARCWYDPYLQAPIDLSALLWLGTANNIDDVPEQLRDRFRFLAFPEPTEDHLEALARTLMREIVEERGLHHGWVGALTWPELEALWKVWPGGSVRALRRYLEAVMTARENAAAQTEPN